MKTRIENMIPIQKQYQDSTPKISTKKERMFQVNGKYIANTEQDKYVYQHNEVEDCYVVYKRNRVQAHNPKNWGASFTQRQPIEAFNKSCYTCIWDNSHLIGPINPQFYPPYHTEETHDQYTSENTDISSLLSPLSNVGVSDLLQLFEHCDKICLKHLILSAECSCYSKL